MSRIRDFFEDVLVFIGLDYSRQMKIIQRYNSFIFPKKKQLELVDDLQSWIEDGGNIRHACESILLSAENLNEGEKPYAKATQSILDAVTNGRSIAEGMENWFSQETIMVFTVGQESNALNEMLSEYKKQVEEITQARTEFIKPIIYPLILFVLSIVVGLVIANFVLDKLTEVFPFQSWPVASRNFYTIYKSLYAHGWMLLLFLWGVFLFFTWWTVNSAGPLRRAAQNYFPFKIYSYFKALQISKMMALLVGRVYSPREAALHLEMSASPFLAWHLRLIAQREALGSQSIAYSFNTGLFPPRLIQRMEAITARGGAQSKIRALETAGKRSADEAFRAIKVSKNTVVATCYVLIAINILFSINAFFGVYMDLMAASG